MPHNQVKGHQIHQALLAAAHQHDDGTDVGAFIAELLREAAEACDFLDYPTTFNELEARRDAVMSCQHQWRASRA